MKHFIKGSDCIINVEHISSILAGHHRQDGRTTITLINGREFYLKQSIDDLLIAIAEAYKL
jgi:uncharacterized protein YlzI (FlbEa/FlbD family)